MENQFTDYYIKADSAEQLYESLMNAGITSNINGTLTDPIKYCLYIIGEMYTGTGQFRTVNDGIIERQMEEIAPLPGFHANLRVLGTLNDDQIATLPLVPAPATPKFIWA